MLITITHILALTLVPPLLLGIINRTKSIIGGRKGPPLLQPYYDIWRLLQKDTVQSTTTSWLFRFGPVANLVTVVVAALLIPLGQAQSPVSFTGDLIFFAYVLALGRFFLVLSALDTGSAFEGMGVAREVTFACFAEPAMFFCLLVLAKECGSLELTQVFGAVPLSDSGVRVGVSWLSTPLLLVLISWFLIMLAENCRIPFDDPNTHLELTMIHEVIVLDHSGPMLGIIQIGAAMKLFVFASLTVRLAVPLHIENGVLAWGVFLVAVIVVAILLGLVESVMARLRMKQVPQVLTAAAAIAAFGYVLTVTMS